MSGPGPTRARSACGALPARAGGQGGRWLVAALLLLAPCAATGQIYAGAEADTGTLVLSNFRTERTPDPIAATLPIAAAAAAPARPERAAHAAVGARPSAQLSLLIDAVARRNRLAPALLHAVIAAESGYDPRAVSARGAIGLMQLLPATGQRFGARDLFSVEQNIGAGAGYLSWLMTLFDSDLELVLAAYNAGEQAVIHAGRKVPPYPETQAYVRAVLRSLERSAALSL